MAHLFNRQPEHRMRQPSDTPEPAVADPEGTIQVTAFALRAVLHALLGEPHYIRELQATRLPVTLFPDNPINVLIADYHKHQQAAPATEPGKTETVDSTWLEQMRREYAQYANEVLRLRAENAKLRKPYIPAGWRIQPCSIDEDMGYIIGSPRVEGVRHNTSVWFTDDDPAHRLLALLIDYAERNTPAEEKTRDEPHS